MRVRPAFAKINLALEVTGIRPDGYHDVDSVVTSIDWHDLVSMDLRPAANSEISLKVSGATGDIPVDSSNLAWQAASRLIATSGRHWTVDIRLEKRIPAGAGLGGGSSDAATVLTLGASLLAEQGLPMAPARLHEIAVELGSDVPVMLIPGTYRVRGRGEVLDCLPTPHLAVVVVVLNSNATRDVYAKVRHPQTDGRAERVAASLMTGSCDTQAFGSALEVPASAAYPTFASALAKLRQVTPGLQWSVTGSGGAAFAPVDRGTGAIPTAVGQLGWPARLCRSVI